MSSWVEDEARIQAVLFRDGPELWRDLKSSLHQAVKDYTRIYSPPGMIEVQCTDCASRAENCVRIRVVPPGKPETSAEVHFSLENQQLECAGKVVFMVAVESGEVLFEDMGGTKATIENVSRALLKPLFDKLPRRKPNISA
ncbi:MAG TPA: hypothetical protein VLX58_15200 [Bryobacteraceae bacterium]|nr:hypothetical protein [Bryobacteraceae bacterium]